MKSFMANEKTVERKWYLVDATNMPIGRLTSQVAAILHGKNKPTFTPHVDGGDFVVIVNSDKVILTGNKPETKIYRHHSSFMGGMKEIKAKHMLEKKSDLAIRLAVKGMLPHTNQGKEMLSRLKVFKGNEHTHEAQKPEKINLVGGRN